MLGSVLCLALAAGPQIAAGQDAPSTTDTPAVSGPYVTPSGALYRSLAVPGWGQIENGRRDKAILFALAETLFLGGFVYKNIQSQNASGPEREALRTDQNTFLIYFLVAKVFDIMDAYVDAQFRTYDVGDITPPALAPAP